MFAFKYADTPIVEMAELLELTVEAGRRCTHDLEHCAQDGDTKEHRELWYDRVRVWHSVFYPGMDGKNYRTRLFYSISELEHTIEKLVHLCEEHNIADDKIKDITDPFFRD